MHISILAKKKKMHLEKEEIIDAKPVQLLRKSSSTMFHILKVSSTFPSWFSQVTFLQTEYQKDHASKLNINRHVLHSAVWKWLCRHQKLLRMRKGMIILQSQDSFLSLWSQLPASFEHQQRKSYDSLPGLLLWSLQHPLKETAPWKLTDAAWIL